MLSVYRLIVSFLFVTPFILCSCTSKFATTGEYQYQKSKNAKELRMPDNFRVSELSQLYKLPDYQLSSTPSIVPPQERTATA